jgi:hypothetical protein
MLERPAFDPYKWVGTSNRACCSRLHLRAGNYKTFNNVAGLSVSQSHD